MMISFELQKVSKTFGTQMALQDMNANFNANILYGLIGAEGAGKTTLFRCLLRLLLPESGRIIYREQGQEVQLEKIREFFSYMPSRQSLYGDLSIHEHLEFFKDLYQVSRDDYLKRREELLKITRLEEFVNRKARELSGGMYKKLGIMCALLQNPKVLLLDEPTNGVDPISRRELWDLFYRLLEKNMMIVLATAYMDEAEKCHQVLLLDSGRVLISGEPKQILQTEGVSGFDEYFIKKMEMSHV